MVWGGDGTGAAHTSSRSNVDLEIGCLIDLATGLVTFTVNGKDISTSYQVLTAYVEQTEGENLKTLCLTKGVFTPERPRLMSMFHCLH